MARSVTLLSRISGRQMDHNNLQCLVVAVPVSTIVLSSQIPTNAMSNDKHAQSPARATTAILSIRLDSNLIPINSENFEFSNNKNPKILIENEPKNQNF